MARSVSRPGAAAGSDVVCQPLTSVPLHGFQRTTAAALCDLTTEVLRTINATEKAMVEYGLSEPVDRSHLVGTDVKQADDAFRELEENVSFKHHKCTPHFPLTCVCLESLRPLLARLSMTGLASTPSPPYSPPLPALCDEQS